MYFVFNWCMIGMLYDLYGKLYMNDMYCRMIFIWLIYCVRLYFDLYVYCYIRLSTVSYLSVCYMWYDVFSNCYMVDSLYLMISMECYICLYCCLSLSYYDRMIYCWLFNFGFFVYVGYGRSDIVGVFWRLIWMFCWIWCRWSGLGC